MWWWQKKVRPEEKEEVGDSQVQLGFLCVERVPFSCLLPVEEVKGYILAAAVRPDWLQPGFRRQGFRPEMFVRSFCLCMMQLQKFFNGLNFVFILLFFHFLTLCLTVSEGKTVLC